MDKLKKKIMTTLALCALWGCAATPVQKSGKDFASAVDALGYYYKLTAANRLAPLDKDAVRKKSMSSIFNHSWCTRSATAVADITQLLGDYCAAQGGSLVKGRWCLANQSGDLKFSLKLNDFASLTERESQDRSSCLDASFVQVHLAEYTPDKKIAQALIQECPRLQLPPLLLDNAQGKVLEMIITVASDGSAKDINITSSTGLKIVDHQVSEKYKSCDYVPKFAKGEPVESTLKVRIPFKDVSKDSGKEISKDN